MDHQTMVPSLAALMADESVDKTGAPIPIDYGRLRPKQGSTNKDAMARPWVVKASENRDLMEELLGDYFEEDLNVIRSRIAPAARDEEVRSGARGTYTYIPEPIEDDHAGLRDSKIVPVKLNLDEGVKINSFAGERALLDNNFSALSTRGLPDEDRPDTLRRWRIYGRRGRVRQPLPTFHILWEDFTGKSLFARVPKPLEGLSHVACDHCRLHDRDREDEHVQYFDDRPQFNKIHDMSSGDTAPTPFSLCRFHWWYVYSGELLRRSQLLALNILVSGDLRDRWGITHTREFLESMNAQLGAPGPALSVAPSTNGDAKKSTANKYERPSAQGPPLANTVVQQAGPSGQQASTPTASVPHDNGHSDQRAAEFVPSDQNHAVSNGSSSNGVEQPEQSITLEAQERIQQRAEGLKIGTATVPLTRPMLFQFPALAAHRRGVSLPHARSYLDRLVTTSGAQEIHGSDARHANGVPHLTNGSAHPGPGSNRPGDPPSSAPRSPPPTPAPGPRANGITAGAPRENGRFLIVQTFAKVLRAGASQANGHAAPTPRTSISHQQTDSAPAPAPAPRTDGLRYSPPMGPRSEREKKKIAGNGKDNGNGKGNGLNSGGRGFQNGGHR
ncbi:hypothetical protein diail_5380 [Diaporthe ilicicola]|nr:hypothetical protein diail_5380 [Diaporthe ilicicola]